MNLLSSYHWPGNLRELENVIEYSMNIETETILTENSLPAYLLNKQLSNPKVETGLCEAERGSNDSKTFSITVIAIPESKWQQRT